MTPINVAFDLNAGLFAKAFAALDIFADELVLRTVAVRSICKKANWFGR
jgi:hypothetical protein